MKSSQTYAQAPASMNSYALLSLYYRSDNEYVSTGVTAYHQPAVTNGHGDFYLLAGMQTEQAPPTKTAPAHKPVTPINKQQPIAGRIGT